MNLFLTRASITTLIAILISSPAQAAFVTERSLSENKNYRLELFSDDASAATPTQVRIDTSQIKRGHVINLAVAARNGFSAILTPE